MRKLLSLPLLLLLACSGNDSTDNPGDDSIDFDPRCVDLCAIIEPDVKGAYDICSEASAAACESQCAVRIAEVDTLCASCLLENSCFTDTGCDESDGDSPQACQDTTCTVSGREGSCTYNLGDDAGYEDCLRVVFPRREVECSPEFRSVTECAEICT